MTRLINRVTTPLVHDDYLDLFAPLRSGAALRARIVSKQMETANSCTLTLQPGKDWTGHLPGQYVRLGVTVNGVRLWRAYSLTSKVAAKQLSITVKAVPDGVVSNYLVSQAQVGELLELAPATGEFTLPATHPAKILFITGGSGITPILGMLRNLSTPSDIVLVNSNLNATEVIAATELAELAAANKINLISVYTDEVGLLTAEKLVELVPDYTSRNTWTCGPSGLTELVKNHWQQQNLTPPNIERFTSKIQVTGSGGTLNIAGKQLPAAGNQPLLEVAEAGGVLMKSGCRMGICFGCATELTSGAVRDLRNGDLTTASPGDGVIIQPCITAAAGDCQLSPAN